MKPLFHTYDIYTHLLNLTKEEIQKPLNEDDITFEEMWLYKVEMKLKICIMISTRQYTFLAPDITDGFIPYILVDDVELYQ